MLVGIVEAQVGEVHVVIDVRLDFFLCSTGEEYVRDAGLLSGDAFAVNELHGLQSGVEGLEVLASEVVIGFSFSSVGGSQGVPVHIVFRFLLCRDVWRKHISGGHPCL